MKSCIDLVINLEKNVRRLTGSNTIYMTVPANTVLHIRRTLMSIKYWQISSSNLDVNVQYALTSIPEKETPSDAFIEYCNRMVMKPLQDHSTLEGIEDGEYRYIIIALS